MRSEVGFYGDALAEQKNIISERISDDIPPQMKFLNIVIPILMHFWVSSKIPALQAAEISTTCEVINDIKLLPTVYRMIHCLKLFKLSNQTSR